MNADSITVREALEIAARAQAAGATVQIHVQVTGLSLQQVDSIIPDAIAAGAVERSSGDGWSCVQIPAATYPSVRVQFFPSQTSALGVIDPNDADAFIPAPSAAAVGPSPVRYLVCSSCGTESASAAEVGDPCVRRLHIDPDVPLSGEACPGTYQTEVPS